VLLLSHTKFQFFKVIYLKKKDIEKLSEGNDKNSSQIYFWNAVIRILSIKYRWDYFNSVTIGEVKITEQKLSIFFNEEGLVDSWILKGLLKKLNIFSSSLFRILIQAFCRISTLSLL
jgi:hypothetical protein